MPKDSTLPSLLPGLLKVSSTTSMKTRSCPPPPRAGAQSQFKGLTHFFIQVHKLMTTIDDLSAQGSYICMDLINTLEKEACSFRSGVDNPEAWVANGWRNAATTTPTTTPTPSYWKVECVRQPGDEGANYGRFLRPFPPRKKEGDEGPDVRRAFLVTMVKTSS